MEDNTKIATMSRGEHEARTEITRLKEEIEAKDKAIGRAVELIEKEAHGNCYVIMNVKDCPNWIEDRTKCIQCWHDYLTKPDTKEEK